MNFSKGAYVVFFIAGLLCSQVSFGKQQNKIQILETAPGKLYTIDDPIVFLLFKFFKDSTTQKNSLVLLDRIIKPGTLKAAVRAESLASLPYLSFVFYNKNLPVDSVRRRYPLRERLQNTKATVEGYKDIEIGSSEFFIRFQQGRINRVKVFEVSFSDKRELIAIDL